MFYKLIGFLVWTGLKVELRRRWGLTPQKLAAGVVVGGALAAGAVAAARSQRGD
jgi:hypothetical protein